MKLGVLNEEHLDFLLYVVNQRVKIFEFVDVVRGHGGCAKYRNGSQLSMT